MIQKLDGKFSRIGGRVDGLRKHFNDQRSVFFDRSVEKVPQGTELFFKNEIVIAQRPKSNESLHRAKE